MGESRLGREARKKQTRQALIDAAAAVFAKYGFDRTSLDQVAEAAGFTKGAVYSNFRGKTDLFMAVIERRVADQLAAITGAAAGATLAEATRRLRSSHDASTAVDFDWLQLAVEFWSYAMREERARAAMAQQYERARTASAQILAGKFTEAGVTPPLPVRDLAILIEALGVGLAFQAAVDPGALRPGLQADALRLILGSDPGLGDGASPTAAAAGGGSP